MKIKPPKNPSHDFFGEIDGRILCFPNLTPIMYANVSNVQVSMNINNMSSLSIQ